MSNEDVANGYALACQTVVEGNLVISVPPQEQVARRLTSDRIAAEITIPERYDFHWSQSIRRYNLTLTPPSMEDQTDDWSRLTTALRIQAGVAKANCSIAFLRKIGSILRAGEWRVHAILDTVADEPEVPARLIDLRPGHFEEDYDPLWASAIDIGTGALVASALREELSRRGAAGGGGAAARIEGMVTRSSSSPLTPQSGTLRLLFQVQARLLVDGQETAQVRVRREVDYLGEVDAVATEGRRRLAIRRAATEAAREIVERLETP